MSLLVFGLGYSAGAVLRRIAGRFEAIVGTTRSGRSDGASARTIAFDGVAAGPELLAAIDDAEAVLVSIQPGEAGDPVLAACGERLARAKRIRQIHYLSTIGVYGDHAGAWIDEGAALRGAAGRGRVRAEEGWRALGAALGAPVHLYRLGGIYGPGRNPLVDLARGTARRIDKPGQVFNRIHVEDIAAIVAAGMADPGDGGAWNVVDDEPAPPAEVVRFAAEIAGVEPPPLIPFAQATLSPMAAAFYADNRRVSNRAVKRRFLPALAYPTYREGLEALLADGAFDPAAPSLRARDRAAPGSL
jgi:nucleoside-diphosphate-sugar epimerase